MSQKMTSTYISSCFGQAIPQYPVRQRVAMKDSSRNIPASINPPASSRTARGGSLVAPSQRSTGSRSGGRATTKRTSSQASALAAPAPIAVPQQVSHKRSAPVTNQSSAKQAKSRW